MKLLTKERVASQSENKARASTRDFCLKYGNEYGVNPSILLSVFIIETFYRPFWMRIVEYSVVLFGCLGCLLLKRPIKNYTIGKCQIGLATILNFYGGNFYQHSHNIKISSISEIRQIFSIISEENSIKILAYRLQPITHKAMRIYPDLRKSRIRYIGEQFNGRYSYGMLLNEVFSQIA